MNHFKNILLYSFICSIVLFTNCGEDEEEQVEEQVEELETTPITTGLSENQDLLIGSWVLVEDCFTNSDITGNIFCMVHVNNDTYKPIEAGSGLVNEVYPMGYEFVYSFPSDNSFRLINTVGIGYSEGHWSFDEFDSLGMTLNIQEHRIEKADTGEPDTLNYTFEVTSISNKRMSAIKTKPAFGWTETGIQYITHYDILDMKFIKQ